MPAWSEPPAGRSIGELVLPLDDREGRSGTTSKRACALRNSSDRSGEIGGYLARYRWIQASRRPCSSTRWARPSTETIRWCRPERTRPAGRLPDRPPSGTSGLGVQARRRHRAWTLLASGSTMTPCLARGRQSRGGDLGWVRRARPGCPWASASGAPEGDLRPEPIGEAGRVRARQVRHPGRRAV